MILSHNDLERGTQQHNEGKQTDSKGNTITQIQIGSGRTKSMKNNQILNPMNDKTSKKP